jgi:hypothetical protein
MIKDENSPSRQPSPLVRRDLSPVIGICAFSCSRNKLFGDVVDARHLRFNPSYSETFQHPDVAVRDVTEDGKVAAVRGGNAPNSTAR